MKTNSFRWNRHLWSLWILVMLQMSGAAAQTVGTVIDLSGSLLAKKSDGVVKVLSQKSAIEQGDLLESQKNSYARIKFIDNSEVTLRPDTQFKVDKFSFDEAKPENDNSVFSLIKGGLRSITGLLGKRNSERYQLTTPVATIGVRGTRYIAEYLPSAQSGNNKEQNDSRDSGLYIQVEEGIIYSANGAATLQFTVGQFGYVASFQQAPVILKINPGIHFSPPASFSASNASKSRAGGASCLVR